MPKGHKSSRDRKVDPRRRRGRGGRKKTKGGFQAEGAEDTYVLEKIYIYIYIPIHVTAAHGRRKEEACMGHLRGRGTKMGDERRILSNKPILLRRASRVYPKGVRGTWRTTRGFQPATLFTPSIPLPTLQLFLNDLSILYSSIRGRYCATPSLAGR